MSSTLAQALPHLRDAESRRRSLIIAVASSSEIEGISNAFTILGAPQLRSRNPVVKAKLTHRPSRRPARKSVR